MVKDCTFFVFIGTNVQMVYPRHQRKGNLYIRIQKRITMIPVGSALQTTAIDVLKDLITALRDLIIDYINIIVLIIGVVILYFVLTRVIFKGSVYKSAHRESMCVLTMAGRERSLEYLERFGEIRGAEVQVIEYLRGNKNVSKKYLEKTFGVTSVRTLIEKGMIKVV